MRHQSARRSGENPPLWNSPAKCRSPRFPRGAGGHPLPLTKLRRRHIERALDTSNGNRVGAVRVVGIGRTSLYRFLESSAKESTAWIAA
jgi:DNA-binding NtrC family response regulator